jgi:molecular chaperone HtpG
MTETVSTPIGNNTHVFQAEVKQLLNLMIHSLYSNREIFLRELISNASDALDKRRFLALSDASLGGDEAAIRLSFDSEAKTITLVDTGIGMDANDAQSHLGTIAKSGTKEFFGQLSGDQQKDAGLIGQFGVGFYSAFIVAKQVIVRSRKAGQSADAAIEWSSEGQGEYTLNTVNKAEIGTEIVLHLRDDSRDDATDATEFANRWKLSALVKKYSNHIAFPIQMLKEDWDETTNALVKTDEWETINEASSLWTRSKNDLTEADYHSFYATLSYDQDTPLAYTHNRVEGRSEYTQLLYIPKKASFDLWDREHVANVKLYVKRVFIMDDAKALMPSYLRFVKGLIDSNDLPLNVSRELLQESRDVKAIREGSTKRILTMLEDLAANKVEDYIQFYTAFGTLLKEGVGEDFANKDRIAKLLRFTSTTQDRTSFAEYLTRMKPEQTQIYVITADSLAAAKTNPQLEGFKKKGVEVLLLTDRVDEWMLSHLQEFEGKPITNVTKGSAGLDSLQDEAEKAEAAKIAEDLKPLVESIKSALGDAVKEVRTTTRLTDSAACLVVEDGDMSGHLARMLKQAGQAAPVNKPILEINPKHALVTRMQNDANQLPALAQLLLDHATLAEGGQLEDPAGYVQRMQTLLLA